MKFISRSFAKLSFFMFVIMCFSKRNRIRSGTLPNLTDKCGLERESDPGNCLWSFEDKESFAEKRLLRFLKTWNGKSGLPFSHITTCRRSFCCFESDRWYYFGLVSLPGKSVFADIPLEGTVVGKSCRNTWTKISRFIEFPLR